MSHPREPTDNITVTNPLQILSNWRNKRNQPGFWYKLASLYNLSYWTRLWIVQEIGLAARLEIYYGQSHVDWSAIEMITEGMTYDVTSLRHVTRMPHTELACSVEEGFRSSIPGRLADRSFHSLVLCSDEFDRELQEFCYLPGAQWPGIRDPSDHEPSVSSPSARLIVQEIRDVLQPHLEHITTSKVQSEYKREREHLDEQFAITCQRLASRLMQWALDLEKSFENGQKEKCISILKNPLEFLVEDNHAKARIVSLFSRDITSLMDYSWSIHHRLSKGSRALNRYRKERLSSSHRLQGLLEDCERSVCWDPRDKVYGLLGLASNLGDEIIKIDYSRSLFEVYGDTIKFVYSTDHCKQEVPAARLCRFSQLLQRSLGGPLETNRTQNVRASDPDTESIFQVTGFVDGSIVPLEDNTARCTFTACNRQMILDELLNTDAEPLKRKTRNAILEQFEAVKDEIIYPSSTIACYGTTDSSLGYDEAHFQPPRSQLSQAFGSRLFISESGLIGISSQRIREDDILIQFSGCDVAAIMRPADQHYKFVARAFMARRLDEQEQRVSASSPELFRFSVPKEDLGEKNRMYIWIDTITLQALTCPATGEKRNFSFAVV
jgi:hypothetical protein